MPIYPALALLLGSAMARNDSWTHWGTRVLGLIFAICGVCVAILLYLVRGMPAPGDISRALEQHPEAYTLSMGHMGDLTLQSFAYLRLPLVLAGVAFLVGAIACWTMRSPRVYLAVALMMVLFIHASRAALVVFDPYLSSRPIAAALMRASKGELIINGAYYAFSSVIFYTGRNALLWNGRFDNLEYGSYAPGSAPVFIDDHQFQSLWNSGERYFVLSDGERKSLLLKAADGGRLFLVMESGGKTLYSNLPVSQ